MEWTRKTLGALFAVLGAYYGALGIFILIRLPSITRQWIERSGDPDFRFDYGSFTILSALGAIAIALLGWSTAVKGLATLRGRRVSWLWPAVAAVPLHWFWLLHRIIGAGTLDRQAQIVVQRNAAMQFGVVCLGYIVLWFMSRRPGPSGSTSVGLQASAGRSGVSWN